ncbi:hypothetical protein CTEN210_18387 [Chaetoceros tenuissimus]|uniref:Reverse transcriptase n=1 Tax=Chaetoceros tenuissimus TaxID=426638 RepID=A0AAD3DEN1_9STRA|nr:hypothetical protein CTEN210_18387 [Chaetoceros tenuissimus]
MNPALDINDDFWQEPTDCLMLDQESLMWKEYINSPRKYNLREFLFDPTVRVEVNSLQKVDQMKMTNRNPVTLILPKLINGMSDVKLMRGLIDSGSDKTAIVRAALPSGCPLTEIPAESFLGFGGMATIHEKVTLQQVILPEFSRSLQIESFDAVVMDGRSNYDIILGRDFLQKIGLILDFENLQIKWMNMEISMKPARYWNTLENVQIAFAEYTDEADEEPNDGYAAAILPSKYDDVSPDVIAAKQTHLDKEKQQDLEKVLHQFPTLFNGKLKQFKGEEVHLTLKKDAKPVQSKPYKVPFLHRQVFKNELDRLVEEGVMEKAPRSEWVAPTFIIPKKDGRVRWVSDFRELNKNLIRKQYTLPRIHDIFERRNGYKYFTKLDISMQYYTFKLDKASSMLCTIATPFGLYRYLRLPMGILESPDIAQEIMERLLANCDCEVYIDDIGIFSKTWKEHIAKLNKILHILQDANFTINPLKCEWAVQETDWLGHWLTPVGIKPWEKKIKPLLALPKPRTTKEVKSFLGAVNFYKDMWKRRSHLQQPLTELLKKGSFKWGPAQDKAFEQIKALMASDVLLYYPDHNKAFHIYTDSSDYQLGSSIAQYDDDGILHPVAYFSRKLNSAQMNYTVGDKEFLSIFETLRTYRTMLLGAEIHLYTDHQNLTFKNINSQRILRWRMYIEEYGPKLHFIPGETNTLADYFSRVELNQQVMEEKSPGPTTEVVDSYYQDIVNDDWRLAECLLPISDAFINVQENALYPMNFDRIQLAQQRDASLQQLRQQKPQEYVLRQTGQHNLIYHRERIFIPQTYAPRIIRWYHNALNHPGIQKLLNNFNQHFFSPKVIQVVTDVVSNCEFCQRNKTSNVQYGHLPPRNVTMQPWHTVAVDLIGPWKMKIQGIDVEFRALTIVDNDTNLLEAVRIENTRAQHIADLFENTWLSRYPRPVKCIHDKGTEFTGSEFQQMLQRFHIRPSQITTKNPQGNSICERIHQTMLNQIRSLLRQNPPNDINQANHVIDTLLANTVYALRTSLHSSLNASPGALAFQRDMILNMPFIADLNNIRNRRQEIVNRSNDRENANRLDYNYQVGDWILIRSDAHQVVQKLEERWFGPFQITQVHVNGNVTIRRRPGVVERINIRRIKPYRQ